jgi:hypothetical protein
MRLAGRLAACVIVLVALALVPASASAVLAVTPTTVSFGNVYVGTTSSPSTITISATGTNESFTINGVSISGSSDFAVSTDNCAPYPRTVYRFVDPDLGTVESEGCTLEVQFDVQRP